MIILSEENKVLESRVFRIYPTPQQEEFIKLNITYMQRTWNSLLYLCYKPIYDKFTDLPRYERSKKVKKYLKRIDYDEVKELFNNSLKKAPKRADMNEPEWCKDCDNNVYTTTYRTLKQSFTNYFKNPKHFGIPKFKKHDYIKYGGGYQTGYRFKFTPDDNVIALPKMQDWYKRGLVDKKTMDIIQHHVSDGRKYKVNVKRKPDNTYWVIIVYEQDEHTIKRPKTGKTIGIDLNVTSDSHIVLSNGDTYCLPFDKIKAIEKKIEKQSRLMSRKYEQWKKEKAIIENNNKTALIPEHVPLLEERGNYQRNRLKKAKLQAKINHIKEDFIKKTCSDIANKYDVVVMEDLNVSGMVKNGRLARAVSRANFREIRNTLSWMLSWSDKQIVFIDRFYPSSKLCSDCGFKNKELTLSDREWTCPNCGTHHIRDINAAKNIEYEGLRLLEEGLIVTDKNDPNFGKMKNKTKPKKKSKPKKKTTKKKASKSKDKQSQVKQKRKKPQMMTILEEITLDI